MNRTYIDVDPIMDTKTVINIKSDGFDATLTITYKTGSELDRQYIYSGTRVCFHRLVKTIISLYERGNYSMAGFYSHAFKDLLDTWFSSIELQRSMEEHRVNDPIDLINILLKEGAFKTFRINNTLVALILTNITKSHARRNTYVY